MVVATWWIPTMQLVVLGRWGNIKVDKMTSPHLSSSIFIVWHLVIMTKKWLGDNVGLFCLKFTRLLYEPRHDKTNKMVVRPAKTRISLGIRPVWSVFAARMKKSWVLSYPLSAQRRLWSDWADAQADPSLRWAHTHFVGFVMSWLTSDFWLQNTSHYTRHKS